IQRALEELTALAERLVRPRTRFRSRPKVDQAVQEILDRRQVGEWVQVTVHQDCEEILRQTHRGRPGPNTTYVHDQFVYRYRLTWEIDAAALARAQTGDGVFPLITNAVDLDALAAL